MVVIAQSSLNEKKIRNSAITYQCGKSTMHSSLGYIYKNIPANVRKFSMLDEYGHIDLEKRNSKQISQKNIKYTN